MSLTQNVALAFLVQQNQQEQSAKEAEEVTFKVIRNPGPQDGTSKAAPKVKLVKAPIHQQSETFNMAGGMALPPKNTLGAHGFMAAVRAAGKRVNAEGKPFFDPSLVREDTIRAIASYVGWNPSQNYGAQETAARMKASREIQGTPITLVTPAETRAAFRSIQGFVAGMPNALQARAQQLQGEEVKCIDALLQHRKDAMDPHQAVEKRMLSQGLMELEEERLKAIRSEMRELGF